MLITGFFAVAAIVNGLALLWYHRNVKKNYLKRSNLVAALKEVCDTQKVVPKQKAEKVTQFISSNFYN